MRYSIRQMNPQGELWLVRVAKKKGVWGAQERAYGFFRRPTAARWVDRLGAANPGIILEIIEMGSQGVAAAGTMNADDTPATNIDDVIEDEAELEPAILPA
jgi:hypothetical protein